MSQPTFDQTVEELVAYSDSGRVITQEFVDASMGAFLVGLSDKATARRKVADAFRERAKPSKRADQILLWIDPPP